MDSLGRVTAGPPRIAGLFTDLDPTQKSGAVRVLAEPGRFVVSWDGVPQYSDSGLGFAERFQIRLYPDGRIEFANSLEIARQAAIYVKHRRNRTNRCMRCLATRACAQRL